MASAKAVLLGALHQWTFNCAKVLEKWMKSIRIDAFRQVAHENNAEIEFLLSIIGLWVLGFSPWLAKSRACCAVRRCFDLFMSFARNGLVWIPII